MILKVSLDFANTCAITSKKYVVRILMTTFSLKKKKKMWKKQPDVGNIISQSSSRDEKKSQIPSGEKRQLIFVTE